jgi:hypothetical protein
VDEAAGAVAALDVADGWHRRWLSRLGWLELEGAVRPVDVVVVDVDAQDAVEVAAVDDQQPVQALGADGPDEALGGRVGARRRLRSMRPVGSERSV